MCLLPYQESYLMKYNHHSCMTYMMIRHVKDFESSAETHLYNRLRHINYKSYTIILNLHKNHIVSIITIFVLGFAEVFSPSMRNDIFSYFLKKVLHSYPMCVLRMHICTQPILAHIIAGSGIAQMKQN